MAKEIPPVGDLRCKSEVTDDGIETAAAAYLNGKSAEPFVFKSGHRVAAAKAVATQTRAGCDLFVLWLLTRCLARWIKASYEAATVPQFHTSSVRHSTRCGDGFPVVDGLDSFCAVDPILTTEPVHSISSLGVSLTAGLRVSVHGGAPRTR
ncbi:hypothetical protein ACRAWG_21885 [Methylobacterium sp. P31]